MQLRPLNLETALRLASILSQYVDVKKLDPEQEALDFVGDILKNIDALDHLHCMKIMTNKTEDDLFKMGGDATLALFVKGLRDNKVVSLLGFYKSLGL